MKTFLIFVLVWDSFRKPDIYEGVIETHVYPSRDEIYAYAVKAHKLTKNRNITKDNVSISSIVQVTKKELTTFDSDQRYETI